MLPTRETIRRDGEIVREIGLSNSTAALAPWMRPPTPLGPPAAAPSVIDGASYPSSVAAAIRFGSSDAASDAAALRLATISASPDATVAVNLEGMEQMAALALEGSPATSPPPPPVAPVVRTSGARSFNDGRMRVRRSSY